MYCKICGKYNCKEHSFLLGETQQLKEFSGSSPPEVFVGKWDYPNVYVGILSPVQYGETKIFSSPEIWHKEKIEIPKILDFRKKLIYGRIKSNVKLNQKTNNFTKVFNEIAMTSKSIATEFKLKKSIMRNEERENTVPLIKNAATIDSVRLEENPKIEAKMDNLVNDTDVKASRALIELNNANIDTSTLIKVLSAGLLGKERARKLVPTRWAITAVDDTLSKNKIKSIKYYPQIQEIILFNAEYLGNHYEFLLLPEEYGFEVIEISLRTMGFWHDYERFFGRNDYASDVTGAYYANRLALSEYLEKIKRQARCIVLRQVSEEYYAPLGVGILRQISREAFSKIPEKFGSVGEALERIQGRINIPIKNYTEKSILLQEYGKQKKINQWLSK